MYSQSVTHLCYKATLGHIENMWYALVWPDTSCQTTWANMVCFGLRKRSISKFYHHPLTVIRSRLMGERLSVIVKCARLNTEAETKWMPFHRRHFQTRFLEWKWKWINSAVDKRSPSRQIRPNYTWSDDPTWPPSRPMGDRTLDQWEHS